MVTTTERTILAQRKLVMLEAHHLPSPSKYTLLKRKIVAKVLDWFAPCGAVDPSMLDDELDMEDFDASVSHHCEEVACGERTDLSKSIDEERNDRTAERDAWTEWDCECPLPDNASQEDLWRYNAGEPAPWCHCHPEIVRYRPNARTVANVVMVVRAKLGWDVPYNVAGRAVVVKRAMLEMRNANFREKEIAILAPLVERGYWHSDHLAVKARGRRLPAWVMRSLKLRVVAEKSA